MNDIVKHDGFLAMVLVLGAFVFLVGVVIGRFVQWLDDRDAAVKAGHAEYYLDEHNNRQWRWRPAPPSEGRENTP